MKPAPFDYHAPTTVDEALELLAEHGHGAAVLAGGQSLVPAMNLRRARPRHVVDINRVRELDRLSVDGPMVHVGALVRHRTLERPPVRDPLSSLLSEIAPLVGHPPVRSRGTLVGSIAFADPSAEWCVLAAALQTEVVLRSARHERTLSAAEFFTGPFATARRDDELISEVRLPALGETTCVAFVEETRTHGDFPVVCAAAAVGVHDGRVAGARVGIGGIAPTPVSATAVEESLRGCDVDDASAVDESAEAVLRHADPIGDHHASADYRRALGVVVTRRALRRALQRAAA